MSGVFWEAESQPDLGEAATATALSTLTLARALPMAMVDLLVRVTLAAAALLAGLLAPLLELIVSCAAPVLAATGIDTWTGETCLLAVLGVWAALACYTHSRGDTGLLLGRTTLQVRGFIALITFCSAPLAMETAVSPRAVLLCLALQFAELVLASLTTELPAATQDIKFAALQKCIRLEVIIAITVAAFGYPNLSAEDTAAQYYCLIPFLATQLTYQAALSPGPAPAPPAQNGVAIQVAEAPAETTVLETPDEAPEPEVVAEPVEEKKTEEAPAPAEEEATVPEIKPDPEETEQQPEEAADSEPVTNVSVAAAVEKIEGKSEAKDEAAAVAAETEALIKRLQSCLAGLVCLVCSQLGRVTSVLTAATNTLTALPWTAWTLLISNIVSNLLWGAAWLKLTSNQLSYAVPAISLVLPALLGRTRLADCSLTADLATIALAAVQFLLLTGVEAVEE